MIENEIQVLGTSTKKESLRKYWIWIAIGAVSVLIIGILIGRFAIRESRIVEPQYGESTIDSCLQVTVDSLLKEKMTEINAQSGQAIVMEVASGEIRAMVGLQKRFDGEYEPCRNFGHQQESSLMHGVSMLTLLETGKYDLSTIVDTKDGVLQIGNVSIKDHNWHRGGYGKLTLEEALMYESTIGICIPAWDYYKDKPEAFYKKLESMSFGMPDELMGIPEFFPMKFLSYKDSLWDKTDMLYQFYGCHQKIAPLQMLTFYNAIANNGRMVEPMLHRKDIVVINPQIASVENIRQLQTALCHNVSEGLGIKAATKVVEVAGLQGRTIVQQGENDEGEDYNNNEYRVEFCGYFPANNPRYSIIVSMNKIGRPASGGGQAGPVFRQIAEYMCEKGL